MDTVNTALLLFWLFSVYFVLYYSTAQRRCLRASSARRLAHTLRIYRVNNSDRNRSIHALLYDIMFSLLIMHEARIAYSHKITYKYIHNKLNVMSYNSACIELLRLLLFTLYIHSLCAAGVRSWLVDNDAGRHCICNLYFVNKFNPRHQQ